MSSQFKTRGDVKREVKKVTWWVVAALLGVGVGLGVSVIFFPVGLAVASLAIPAALIGWSLSILLPRLYHYDEVACPRCERINFVREGVDSFDCDYCRLPVEPVKEAVTS